MQTALFKAAKAWDRIEGEPEPYVRRILYTENVSLVAAPPARRRRSSPAYDAPAASPVPTRTLHLVAGARARAG